MKSIRCLVVDDEPVAQRILQGFIDDLPELALVEKCSSAIAARSVLQREEVDLMLLDIQMPKLKGLAFLRTLADPPPVIITTAYREFALDGYELEVIDYLVKPIAFERFLKAINRYKKQFQQQLPPEEKLVDKSFIYVKSDRRTIKIPSAEIVYIEGMNNYAKIILAEGQHIIYKSLTQLLEQLPDYFIRIHKSYIINKRAIRAFTSEYVEIEGKQIPIGKTYRNLISYL